MASIPQEMRRSSVLSTQYSVLSTRIWALDRRMLFASVLLLAGCATTQEFLPGTADTPPTGPVAQVNVAWHNQVVFAPDPVHGGQMSPGLAGRLYLFGPNMGYPVAANGRVVVEAYDPSQRGADGTPLLVEKWNIDDFALKNCLRRDTIGWGYTFVAVGSDVGLLSRGADVLAKKFKG